MDGPFPVVRMVVTGVKSWDWLPTAMRGRVVVTPLGIVPLLVAAVRLSPFSLSGDGWSAGLVVRDRGMAAVGELELRAIVAEGGLAREGDEDAATRTGEIVVWSGRFPIEDAVVATLDSELDELYRIPLRPGAMPGGSFNRSRSDDGDGVALPLVAGVVAAAGIASVSGASREKSTSPHWDSSRFSTRMRFWEEIFSLASRSISCSYSRSLRFRTWMCRMAACRIDRLEVFFSSGWSVSCFLSCSKHSFRCARRFFSSLLWTSRVPTPLLFELVVLRRPPVGTCPSSPFTAEAPTDPNPGGDCCWGRIWC